MLNTLLRQPGAERHNNFTVAERVVNWFFFLNDRLISIGKEDSWPTQTQLKAAP